MRKLTAEQIQQARRGVPHWGKRGAALRRTYVFADFLGAMKFVNVVARRAEKAQHHPDVDIRWNQVTLALTTHDAGGLTERDFALATACDQAAARLLAQPPARGA